MAGRDLDSKNRPVNIVIDNISCNAAAKGESEIFTMELVC